MYSANINHSTAAEPVDAPAPVDLASVAEGEETNVHVAAKGDENTPPTYTGASTAPTDAPVADAAPTGASPAPTDAPVADAAPTAVADATEPLALVPPAEPLALVDFNTEPTPTHRPRRRGGTPDWEHGEHDLKRRRDAHMLRAVALGSGDAGGDVVKQTPGQRLDRFCNELMDRAINDIVVNEGRWLMSMCTPVDGTVDGTVIVLPALPAGQLRDRQVELQNNLNEFNAKAFGTSLSEEDAFRRVGTENTKSRYLTTPGRSTFGNAGPYPRELQQLVETKLKPVWEKITGISRVTIAGAHIFQDSESHFHEHTDGNIERMFSIDTDVTPALQNEHVVLYHQGHPVQWGQRNTTAKKFDRLWVPRTHGSVMWMDPSARQLAHQVSRVEETCASFLIKVIATNPQAVSIIQSSLAVTASLLTVCFSTKP